MLTQLFIDAVSASIEENLKMCRDKVARVLPNVELLENRGNRHELHLILLGDEVKTDETGGVARKV